MSSSLNIPVFAGQGTAAANSPAARKQAHKDASSSAGSLLLAACFEAFHSELSSLSQQDLSKAGIDISDFKNKNALLDIPADRYLNNPIISGPTLFLLQTLRYLAYVESSGAAEDSLTPFSDVLKANIEHNLGVLGFSSGILPAIVVGSSFSVVSYISRSVEAYRLALWIGIRTQQYRDQTIVDDSAAPWSLVFLGLDKKSAEEAIAAFKTDAPLLITAVLDNKSVTISGRPDVLDAFSRTVPSSVNVHKTTVDTLYHSQIHTETLREQLIADVAARDINFPQYADIKAPVRSTFTGAALTKADNGSLVETTINMIITQPVNWDLVTDGLVKATPTDKNIRLINVGPGTGLTRNLEREFPRGQISSIDLTSGNIGAKVQPKQDPIAIVGMGVHVPGARSTEELWRLLEEGINTISEIPEHRFKVSDYNNPKDPKSKRQMKAHTGNFIDGVDEFDNKFFKISPREAKSIDPQQRILLQVAYEALESAGYVPDSTPTWQADGVGCYIGVSTHDYLQNLRDDIDVYYSTGTLKAFLSGRISYALQLSGPSVVVDTACSSSAVSVYQGCRSLMNGDCNAAIVGGVNVISSPDMMLGLDRAHFLSPTGQCKAFDESADGYSRSEGCGIFVLKRLSDAIAENDNIMGVIRGIDVNQCGRAHSITHPHAPTQAVLFRTLLDNSGMDPHRVSVIEAHGTGTQAGDPSELESIRSIFAIKREAENPLHITSVKANIGHCEAASGAAGLAKILLMLKYRTIPRVISLKSLNPLIVPLETDNTMIATSQTEWKSWKNQPRVAMLNNFGAAGSNTATFVEEWVSERSEPPVGLSYAFGLSAKSESALDELRNRYIDWLKGPKSTNSLADIAYTMTARRWIYDHRIAVQANSKEELIEKLGKASPVQVQGEAGKVVFVFSGQGSQYLGMGKTLYETSTLFKKHIDECHAFLVASGFPGVTQIILAGDEGSGLSTLEEFEAYQASIFALEYALAQVWISWGLTPAAVVGHSLGEYAALVVSGVISVKAALTIIANRVRVMVKKCAVETTGMIAVNASQEVVTEAIKSSEEFSGLSIACYNSATDCVVSGPIPQTKAFKTYLDAEVRCKNVVLSVPFGYHSSAMQPLLDDLTAVASKVTINAPEIPIISNVYGDVVIPGDASVFNAEYFARHCAEPVQFDKGIRALVSKPEFNKVAAWLEIGPHTTSLPMLKVNASVGKDALLLGSLKKQQSAWSMLAGSAAQLYLSGVSLNWRRLFSHVDVLCVELPSYPFARTKFWVPFKESNVVAAPAAPVIQATAPSINIVHDYKMLNAWVQFPSTVNGNVAIFETPISDLAGSIRGHSVGGMPLCPASVYLEQVLAGIELAKRHIGLRLDGRHPVLRKVEFAKPLVYDETVARTVITSVSLNNDHGAFSVSSRVGNSEEAVHVHGEYRFQAVSETINKFNRVFPVISRQINAVHEPKGGELPEVFSTRTAYEVIFPRVVDYAKEYHTMQSLTVDPSGMEGVASVKMPADHDKGSYVAHPVFMDTLLHVAGFVANLQGGVNDAYICSEVGTVKAIPELIDNNASYTVYCSNSWVESEGVTIAEAYAVLESNPRRIVAHLKGMHFRRVRLNSLKKGLAHAAGKAPVSKPRAQITPATPPKVAATPAAVVSTPKAPSVDVNGEIIRIIAETCDVSSSAISVDTDLGSLGVDSLMSIEIFGKLEALFPGVELDAHALSHCTSVSDIIKEVSKQTKGLTISQPAPSVPAPSDPVPSDPAPAPSAAPVPTSSSVDVVALVSAIVSDTCDISLSAIGPDTDLGSLGVDSLMSIEIFGKLEEAFPSVTLDATALSHCSSVSDIVKHIPVASAAPTHVSAQPLPSAISTPRTLVVPEEKLVEPAHLVVDGPNVKQLLAGVLDINIKDITDDADFESLGLDSLTSIEALGALKSEFNLDLPGDFFTSYSTAKAVQSYLATRVKA